MSTKRNELECQGCGARFISSRSDSKWCESCRGPKHRLAISVREAARFHPCLACGKPCARKAIRCRACSNRERATRFRGESSPTWKGGRGITPAGYVELRVDGVKVLEHRYVWEQANGPIPDKWVVHHFNGIKTDNRLENLVAMPRSHHGPRAHIDPSAYEARIRELEARIRELEGNQDV